mmetsp:Transcript_1222/g.3818  ORF Transcript_1222/g.3818 Transcript_1222/m.3818 type:complete len:335 (+) Transcript_1222:800-1804(+)
MHERPPVHDAHTEARLSQTRPRTPTLGASISRSASQACAHLKEESAVASPPPTNLPYLQHLALGQLAHPQEIVRAVERLVLGEAHAPTHGVRHELLQVVDMGQVRGFRRKPLLLALRAAPALRRHGLLNLLHVEPQGLVHARVGDERLWWVRRHRQQGWGRHPGLLERIQGPPHLPPAQVVEAIPRHHRGWELALPPVARRRAVEQEGAHSVGRERCRWVRGRGPGDGDQAHEHAVVAHKLRALQVARRRLHGGNERAGHAWLNTLEREGDESARKAHDGCRAIRSGQARGGRHTACSVVARQRAQLRDSLGGLPCAPRLVAPVSRHASVRGAA